MDAKKFINSFYQPLGYLGCDVSNDEMWLYAKKRALEMCLIMIEEHSCYTLNNDRWTYWAQMEREIQNC
mgnify:CR=1 FL=1